MEEAEKVHQALVHGKKAGLLQIDDAAVIVKDTDGKVHVKNQISRGTWSATGVGGMRRNTSFLHTMALVIPWEPAYAQSAISFRIQPEIPVQPSSKRPADDPLTDLGLAAYWKVSVLAISRCRS